MKHTAFVVRPGESVIEAMKRRVATQIYGARVYPETARVYKRRNGVRPWAPADLLPPRTRKTARATCRDLIVSGRLDDHESSSVEYVLDSLTAAEHSIITLVQERDGLERRVAELEERLRIPEMACAND